MSQPSVPSCPICKAPLPKTKAAAHKPFCSARCQTIDLGNWLGERYAIPVSDPEPTSAVADQRGDEAEA